MFKGSHKDPSSNSSSTAPSPADQPIDERSPKDLLSKVPSEPVYPSTSKVLPIVGGLILVLFLLSLDRLIIGVAIPSITDQFDSLEDVGWYGSSYLLTSCAFMLLLGKIYTLANPKWVYLGSLVVFEVGSAICGAAPNSRALIVGRAVAGLVSNLPNPSFFPERG